MTRDTPTDADQLVRDLLAQGSESRVDYKSAKPAPRDVRQRADFAKHVIGLSNRKDGGYLLIGVQDSTLVPVGLTEAQVASWDAAGVNSWLAPFAAPAPVVQVFRGSLEDGKVLIALRVPPFDEQPLVCTTTVNDTGNKPITREGALYIRTEETRTREVSTEAQMRELLGPGLRETGGTAALRDKGPHRCALARRRAPGGAGPGQLDRAGPRGDAAAVSDSPVAY